MVEKGGGKSKNHSFGESGGKNITPCLRQETPDITEIGLVHGYQITLKKTMSRDRVAVEKKYTGQIGMEGEKIADIWLITTP